VEEVGRIVYEIAEAYHGKYPVFVRRLIGKLYFNKLLWRILKKRAARSQERRYPGDWVFAFVEGDGVEFDFGTM